MTSFFSSALGGNPFSTVVGGKIEKATDATLASENWALNIEICDLINESEEAGRDAMKAIRKRLTQNAGKNYNYTIVMYTLTVLETCVKNCGKKFHLLVCSKDFVQELVKLIGPKNDPPTAVQEKVLSLIQSWADAFISQPDLSGVVLVYQDLRSKGIEFPSTDLDCLAPIHTPEKSVKSRPSPPSSDITVTDGVAFTSGAAPLPIASVTIEPNSDLPPGAIQGAIPHTAPMTAPIIISPVAGTLTADQRAKLQSELDVVQANMAVLGEMLSELTPGNELGDELELLQELHMTCHSMQARVVELIGRLANDELTADLLRINDDLNNLFLRYTRFEKNRGDGSITIGMESTAATSKKALGTSPSAVLGKAMSAAAAAKKAEAEGKSLIDWGPADAGDDDVVDKLNKMGVSDSNATAQLAKIGTTTARNGPQGDTDEFDTFAQSRNAIEVPKVGGSSKQPESFNTIANAKNQNRELEFDEIAAWLDETPGAEESVTSSEFDRFLAERAAAADSLPSVTTTTNTSTNKSINSKDEKQIQLL